METNHKMRKLNNARREWEQRHQSNSPFRIDNYGSSSSIGFDSVEGSPMAVNRGYGLRANIAQRGEVSHQPLNLTNNKQSSFAKKNNTAGKNLSSMNSNNSPMQMGSPMTGGKASTMLSSGSNESLSPRPCSVEDEIHEGFGRDSV